MSDAENPNIILTSSFNAVAKELLKEGFLPPPSVTVAFVATAGEPYKERPWIEADRRALVELGYQVTDVTLKDENPSSLKSLLAPFDIIFVAGGNTTYLAEHARRAGFKGVIHDLLRQGKLYVGSSAGSILVGPTVEPFIEEDLPDLPPEFDIEDTATLGLVDYVVLPHHPAFAEKNDKLAKLFKDRCRFVPMKDSEYRTETV